MWHLELTLSPLLPPICSASAGRPAEQEGAPDRPHQGHRPRPFQARHAALRDQHCPALAQRRPRRPRLAALPEACQVGRQLLMGQLHHGVQRDAAPRTRAGRRHVRGAGVVVGPQGRDPARQAGLLRDARLQLLPGELTGEI